MFFVCIDMKLNSLRTHIEGLEVTEYLSVSLVMPIDVLKETRPFSGLKQLVGPVHVGVELASNRSKVVAY